MKFCQSVLLAAFAASTTQAFLPSTGKSSTTFVTIKPSTSVFATVEAGKEATAAQIKVNGVKTAAPATPAAAKASSPAPAITKDEVRALFSLWNDALATGDARLVAKRYSKNPVLLPTISDTPRTDYDGLVDYFELFLKRKPQGVILESFVSIGENWCSDTGTYLFTMGDNGSKVKARYSFVYVYEEGQWKISHQHSSVMPEEIAIGKMITEQEVQALFYRWNDALATLEPKNVANLYSRKHILLPTVSDQERTTYYGLLDYFESFLKLKPQGKILRSNVRIGQNWAQDAGIYEFTMGANGAVVKARYTFVYVYEEGEWKISHHHSSYMPEEVAVAKDITADQVRDLFHLWNDALATGDPKVVADRYSRKAILLPTISDTPRKDYYELVDYFAQFLKLKPQGKIIDSNVIIGTNWCQDAGIYEFTMAADGSKTRARYSFIYIFENGQWKIAQQHSSIMPEAIFNKPKISVQQVKNLFHLWNDALATLDPDAVVARFAKDALLLPTVSDEARTTKEGIREYFKMFLERKPQGKVLESYVRIGDNWCKDGGIYEFTMGADGSKVRARYTFIYVYEDGVWKIAHQHSSVMPEAFLNPKPVVAADGTNGEK